MQKSSGTYTNRTSTNWIPKSLRLSISQPSKAAEVEEEQLVQVTRLTSQTCLFPGPTQKRGPGGTRTNLVLTKERTDRSNNRCGWVTSIEEASLVLPWDTLTLKFTTTMTGLLKTIKMKQRITGHKKSGTIGCIDTTVTTWAALRSWPNRLWISLVRQRKRK